MGAEYIFSTSHRIEADSEEQAWKKFSQADLYSDWEISDVKEADESAVQEPDWIPAGDGRAIGQQNFGINLSPLHAEGKSKCGCGCSIGKCQCPKGCKCGCGDHKADTVGSPSPTFNEDITGQDGPSANPTNATFEAMRTLAPSTDDTRGARAAIRREGFGEVIYDSYLVNQQGTSNKFYYLAISELDGKYYPMAVWDRMGYFHSKLTDGKANGEGRQRSKMRNLAMGKDSDKLGKRGVASQSAAYPYIRTQESDKLNKRKPEKRYVTYQLHNAESLSEIEGPTAEATTGGLHAPSSFAMTWEDGTGQSSASIPPNEIAWAENVKAGEGKIFGMGWGAIALSAVTIFVGTKVVESQLRGRKGANKEIKEAKGCCGSRKRVVKSETVTKHSEYSVGQINPVEVDGQNDIRDAESIRLPTPHAGPQSAHRQNNRPTLKMW
tara:strand:+ start:393 stop:1706 length:1314 start_codon:yes stop_codon:yes gene_type:complete